MATGGCDCGAVRFSFEHEIGAYYACHCTQCRRISGMFWAGFAIPTEALTFQNDEGLRWYASSDRAERGFCGTCGSSLFYRARATGAAYEVAPGAIDGSVGAGICGHIHTGSKGDYYEIADGLPQFETTP